MAVGKKGRRQIKRMRRRSRKKRRMRRKKITTISKQYPTTI